MNWKIEDGLLWLRRDGAINKYDGWYLQRCPYSSNFCGFECPLLTINGNFLKLSCGGTYFNEVENVPN
jgi:hypothetical protein